MKIAYAVLIPLFSTFFACTQPEKIPQLYRVDNAHQDYWVSLQQADLAETALGKDWYEASETAINAPVDILTPFEESIYVDPRTAFALAYRFDAIRGHRYTVEISHRGEKPARIFIDLFRWASEDRTTWTKVASAPKEENRVEFEPRLNTPYVVRIQPELLRGGQFTISIHNQASLDFPVEGYDRRSIGSGFGEPRDGGRREHHGVDIFARRHTPIIAPVDGYIQRVGEQRLGGRTIWMQDGRFPDKHLYFAHLQDYKTETGAMVKTGQIIGTVGNTGNARTTPPHLHFGVYIRGIGPVDPMSYIIKVADAPPPLSADVQAVGTWVRTQGNSTSLRNYDGSPISDQEPLGLHTPMQVLGASSNMYRVQLPDGNMGYIRSDQAVPTAESLENQSQLNLLSLKSAPHEAALTKEAVKPGEEFAILGEYHGYWFVRIEDGQTGWMAVPEPSAAQSSRDSSGH